jgi:hypothetical protein
MRLEHTDSINTRPLPKSCQDLIFYELALNGKIGDVAFAAHTKTRELKTMIGINK